MPCKVETEDEIRKDVEKKTVTGFNISIKEANKLADNVNQEYKTEVVNFNLRTNGTIERTVSIPNTLIDKYYANELVMEENEVSEVQEEDVDYTNEYLYDEMLAVNNTGYDGFNYANYVQNKVNLNAQVQKKIVILENKATKTKKDLEQIESFKEIHRKFEKDLANLSTTTSTLVNYFEYFTKDLEIIADLLDNPSLEDLTLVKDYIDTIKLLTSTDADGFLQENIPAMAKTTGDDDMIESFLNLEKELSKVQHSFNDVEEQVIIGEVKKYLANTKTGEFTEEDLEKEAIDLYTEKIKNGLEDTGIIEAYISTSDDVEDNLLNTIITKVFSDSVATSKKKELRQNLSDIKPLLVAELVKLGYKNTNNFIGKLFNSVSYEVFSKKTEDGSNRLIGKFSSTWTNFKVATKRRENKIRSLEFKKNKNEAEFNVVNAKRDRNFNILKHSVDFIDISHIPEFLEDTEMAAEYTQFFGTTDLAEAQAYRAKLISTIGKREYDKIVKEQMENIYSFQISMDQYADKLMKQEGVNTFSDLSETVQNKYLSAYYTKSPFIFSETNKVTNGNRVTKTYFKDGKAFTNSDTTATLQYNSYIPKAANEVFFDQDFKNIIEPNQVLHQSWEYMADSLEFINQNGHNSRRDKTTLDDSLTHQRQKFKVHLSPGKNYISLLTERTLDWVKNIMTTSQYVSTDDITKLNVRGEIRTRDQVVATKLEPILKEFTHKFNNVKMTKVVPFLSLGQDVQDFIMEKTSKTKEELRSKNTTIHHMLRQSVSEEVNDEQELDLVETLLSQVEVVEKFKARKEVETTMQFLFNKLKNIEISKDKKRDRAVEIARYFIEKHLYGVNNRANFRGLGKKSDAHWWSKIYTTEEQEIRDIVKEAIAGLKTLPTNEAIEKEIESMERMLESGGKVITTGSVIETVILRLARFKAFALNFAAQTKNYAMGNYNAQELDGKIWKAGSYYKAKSYTRKWKSAKRLVSKKEKENYELTTLILNRLQVFQNSANEIFKVEESRYKKSIVKVLMNPMQLPGEVEKTIQRPQILALLGEVDIKDKNGNVVQAFNIDDQSNPHPAFKISDTKGLELMPEFDTKENRDTWIFNTSQEYANLFGDSGKIPKAIAYVNGDYRNNSSYLLERSLAGAMTFMFKRWLPATIKKKHGIYKELAKEGAGGIATSSMAQSAALYGWNATSMFGSVGLAVMAGAYITTVGREMNQQRKKEDIKFLSYVTKSLTSAIVKSQFGLKNVRILGASLAKTGQFVLNPIFGNDIVKNELIEKIAGIQDQEQTTKENMQFLFSAFAKTLIFTALRIGIHAAMYPDDEEKKDYDTKSSFYDRLVKDPDTTLFYILENTLGSLIDDVNLTLSPDNLFRTVFNTKSVNDLVVFSNSLDEQALKGDYAGGDNEGENRPLTKLRKLVIPGAFEEPIFPLGFNTVSKRDFTPKDYISQQFKSNFTVIEEERKRQRKVRKAVLLEEFKGLYEDDDKAESETNKKLLQEFPTVKKYFEKDGTLKLSDYRKFVERYEK